MENNNKIISIFWTLYAISSYSLYILLITGIINKYFYLLLLFFGILLLILKWNKINNLYSYKDIHWKGIVNELSWYFWCFITSVTCWSLALYILKNNFNDFYISVYKNDETFWILARRMIFIAAASDYYYGWLGAFKAKRWDSVFTREIQMVSVIYIFVFLILSFISSAWSLAFVNLVLVHCLPEVLKIRIIKLYNYFVKLVKIIYKNTKLSTINIDKVLKKEYYDFDYYKAFPKDGGWNSSLLVGFLLAGIVAPIKSLIITQPLAIFIGISLSTIFLPYLI